MPVEDIYNYFCATPASGINVDVRHPPDCLSKGPHDALARMATQLWVAGKRLPNHVSWGPPRQCHTGPAHGQ